jgi:hypothetical protein
MLPPPKPDRIGYSATQPTNPGSIRTDQGSDRTYDCPDFMRSSAHMIMKPSLRKLALTAHITFSIGWLGAVVAYLALAIVGLTSLDVQMARAAYLSLDVLARFVIVPFGLATLIIGLVESMGTPWGLFQYWWVSLKFALTTAATIVLLVHLQAITRMSSLAASASFSLNDHVGLRTQLVVHAAGGLLVLFAATLLSVYKPWGLTLIGLAARREQRETSVTGSSSFPDPILETRPPTSRNSTPRWVYIVGFHAIALVMLALIAHLTGTIPRH